MPEQILFTENFYSTAFFLVCVNKCVHTTQKTHSSKFIFDPDFNFEKSKSNVQ